jgi:hypothetical protein
MTSVQIGLLFRLSDGKHPYKGVPRNFYAAVNKSLRELLAMNYIHHPRSKRWTLTNLGREFILYYEMYVLDPLIPV